MSEVGHIEDIVSTLGPDADRVGRGDANAAGDENKFANGHEMMEYIRNLSAGQGKFSKSLTMNRVLKVLISEGVIPEEVRALGAAYSRYAEAQRLRLHTLISSFDGKESYFNQLECAVFNLKYVSVSPPEEGSSSTGESVVTNRIALLAHAMVDARLNAQLVEYHRKLTAQERPAVLTDGVAPRKTQLLTTMMNTIHNVIRKDVGNAFGSVHTFLASIHPEHGEFASTDQLSALMTSLKNSYDTLMSNLSKSGTSTDGRIEPATALQFCKTGRVYNMALFYTYLVWHGKDTTFLSNRLPIGVGRAVGIPPRPPTASATAGASTAVAGFGAVQNLSRNANGTSSSNDFSYSTPRSASSVTSHSSSRTNSVPLPRPASLSYCGSDSEVETDLLQSLDHEGMNESVLDPVVGETTEHRRVSVVGQTNVESKRKRKAAQHEQQVAQQNVQLATTVSSTVSASLQAALAVSPTSKAAKRRTDDATAELRSAQSELAREQTQTVKMQRVTEERKAQIQNLTAAINNPPLFEQLDESQQAAMKEKLFSLLMM